MKKYRAKIDTPWFKKGTIYHEMPYGTYVPDRGEGRCYAIDHPEKWPDVFEPVEEKSNKEKWRDVFMKISSLDTSEMCFQWAEAQSIIFAGIGIDSTKAYEEIVEGK